LVLSLLSDKTYSSAKFFGKDKKISAKVFKRFENSEEILKELIDLFIKGNKSPLYFFPNTSFAYVETLTKDNKKSPIIAARNKWLELSYGEVKIPGENDNPYYKIYFKETIPFEEKFDKDFKDLSEKILSPLLKNLEEDKYEEI